MTDAGDNKRQAERQPVLKSAKVHFSHSVIDCLVVDHTTGGVRLSTEVPVVFPDEVQIELRTGSIWQAVRRWQRGTDAGFELMRFIGLNRETSSRATQLLIELRATSILTLTERLSQEGFFGSPELREATLALETAVETLDKMLNSAVANA